MSSAIFSTAYFPPISYFMALLHYDNIYIESFENYQKQSYRNRMYIVGPNGKQSLNVPIIKTKGNHTTIKDIALATETNWKQQHWNSIKTAYNSSAFMMYYEAELMAVFFKEHKTLWNLNMELLEVMLDFFQFDTTIIETTDFAKTQVDCIDYRDIIHPKKPSISTDKLNEYAYYQVFKDKHGFINDLSCLDLLFNLGPDAGGFIRRISL